MPFNIGEDDDNISLELNGMYGYGDRIEHDFDMFNEDIPLCQENDPPSLPLLFSSQHVNPCCQE